MKQGQFERLYEAHWQDYQVILESLESKPRRRKTLGFSKLTKNTSTQTNHSLNAVDSNSSDIKVENLSLIHI